MVKKVKWFSPLGLACWGLGVDAAFLGFMGCGPPARVTDMGVYLIALSSLGAAIILALLTVVNGFRARASWLTFFVGILALLGAIPSLFVSALLFQCLFRNNCL
jgi:hypothetical protein